MPKDEWFKVHCVYCGYTFTNGENRVIIVYKDFNNGHPKQTIRGHYCEKCFEKISGNGKRY